MRVAARSLPALVVALLAGAIRAFQLYGPRLLTSGGFDVRQLGLVLPFIGIVAILLSPVGTVIAGYVWGMDVSVRDGWMQFTGGVILVAIVGFVGTSTIMLALLLGSRAAGFGALLSQAAYFLISAVGLVSVGLVALAGAAIAEFRDAGA